MSALNRRHWFVASTLLLVTALVVLAICTWYSLKLRTHQGQITGLALTLTRIASLVSGAPDGTAAQGLFQGDQLAQLVATGDIQAESILVAATRFPVNRVIDEYPEVVAHWQAVRGEFGRLNTLAVAPSTIADDNISNALLAVRQSYESLFESIINESLSRPLLKVASSLKANLDSLIFIAGNREVAFDLLPLISRVQNNVLALKSVVNPDNGPALLGYTATRQLQEFMVAIEELPVAAPAAAKALPVNSAGFSETSAQALSYVHNALRFVDVEVHRSRRNVLAALSLACVGILLTTALAWSLKRAGHAAKQSTQQTLNILIENLNHIANGNLARRSNLLQLDQANQPIAELVDYTASMVQGLVSVCRGVAYKTTELASTQQAEIEDLVDSTAEFATGNTQQLADLQSGLAGLRESIANINLQSSAASQSMVAGEDMARADLESSVSGTASSLAGLSAQLELGVGRVERALGVSATLKSVINRMENASQQSNLEALNESIKQAGYHDSGHYNTVDDADIFVQNTQRISRQLQAECETAVQYAREMQVDLEACATALRECLSSVERGAQHSLRANQSLKNYQCVPEPQHTDTSVITAKVSDLIANAQELEAANSAFTTDENLLLLKGHALELQLMAARLDESMLRFELLEPSADER